MKKVYDGIIGLAMGDAIGVPVEFINRQEIAENPVVSMREFGTRPGRSLTPFTGSPK